MAVVVSRGNGGRKVEVVGDGGGCSGGSRLIVVVVLWQWWWWRHGVHGGCGHGRERKLKKIRKLKN
jgi:hypothetical protein